MGKKLTDGALPHAVIPLVTLLNFGKDMEDKTILSLNLGLVRAVSALKLAVGVLALGAPNEGQQTFNEALDKVDDALKNVVVLMEEYLSLMSNVFPFPLAEKISDLEKKLQKKGEPPYDGGMELSERVAKIEAVIPSLASKEDLVREVGGLRSDLHRELHAMTWKIWAFAAGLVTIVFGLAKLIK